MVQQKHFKSRVRERMQKTGESYSAARRQLNLSRQSGPPTVAGLLPGYPLNTPVTHRDAALWHRVLSQAGVENPATSGSLTEAMLAGLAGGIGFMVFTFEYETVTTATVVTRYHPGPYLSNLMHRCGAAVREETTSSSRIAQTNLDAALDDGAAVVVRVTRGALPWIASDALEFSDSVDVVVAGRRQGNYLIDDGGPALLHASAEELAHARARRKSDKHWQAHVEDPGAETRDQLVAAVREGVADTATGLLAREVPAGIPARFAGNFGIPGMRTWVTRLRDTRTRKGWPAMFSDQTRLESALTQLQALLEGSAWGGPGALRPLYADFLDEVSRLPTLGNLAPVAGRYRALGSQWSGLAALIDPSCPVDERSRLFAAMADSLEEIIDAEEAAATSLEAGLR